MKAHTKKRICYLASLSLLFSVLELFIPKPLPFFRLGLANIPIMLSLAMPLKEFLLLVALKAIASQYISGTLFSLFFFISLMQSIASALAMKAIARIAKSHISLYGISLLGAEISAVVQLSLTSLYIGNAVWNYAPLMFIMSLLASVITAFIASNIDITRTPELDSDNTREADKSYTSNGILLTISSISVFLSKDICASAVVFILALLMQRLANRKIKVLPYISIFLFMLFSSFFAPEGIILFEFLGLKAGAASIEAAAIKAFHLASSVAISQSFIERIKLKGNMLMLVAEYFSALIAAFRRTEGTLRERISKTLSIDTLKSESYNYKHCNEMAINIITIALIAICLSSFILHYFF